MLSGVNESCCYIGHAGSEPASRFRQEVERAIMQETPADVRRDES